MKKRTRKVKTEQEAITVEYWKFIQACQANGSHLPYITFVASGLSIGLLRQHMPFQGLTDVITSFLADSQKP